MVSKKDDCEVLMQEHVFIEHQGMVLDYLRAEHEMCQLAFNPDRERNERKPGVAYPQFLAALAGRKVQVSQLYPARQPHAAAHFCAEDGSLTVALIQPNSARYLELRTL